MYNEHSFFLGRKREIVNRGYRLQFGVNRIKNSGNGGTFDNYQTIAFGRNFMPISRDYNVAEPTCGMRTDRAR